MMVAHEPSNKHCRTLLFNTGALPKCVARLEVHGRTGVSQCVPPWDLCCKSTLALCSRPIYYTGGNGVVGSRSK